MEGKYIGTIAHADGGNIETIYPMGVPPIWCPKEIDLLFRREFGYTLSKCRTLKERDTSTSRKRVPNP